MIKRFKLMSWLSSAILLAALAALCAMPNVAQAQNCGPNPNVPAQSYTVGFVKGSVLHYAVQLTLTMGSIIDEPGVDVDTLTHAGSYQLYMNGKAAASGSLVGFADDCTGGTRPLYAYVEFETNAAETADIPLGQPGHMAHWTAQGGVPADGVGWRIALRSDGGATIVAEQPAGDPPGTPRVGNAWPADQVIVSDGLLTFQAMDAQLDAKFPQAALPVPALASSGIPFGSPDPDAPTVNSVTADDPPSPQTEDSDNSVDIKPLYQQESEWCWAAVGEMVFRYFNVPPIQADYQCGIITLKGGQWDQVTLNGVALDRQQFAGPCFPDCHSPQCDVGAGQFANLRAMLAQYPAISAKILGQHVPSLSATLSTSPLSKTTIMNEIDAQRPIIAGVSPTAPIPGGEAEHVVLIVGYSIESNKFYLLVNDPWPFDLYPQMKNPYVAAGGEISGDDQGQYKIEISQFTSKLRWTRALWNIRKSGI